MQRFLAPACLVLCLALLVTAFALLATDAPEPNVALHRARVMGDEAMREVLEHELLWRIWLRRALLGALFAGAAGLGVAAFLTVGGSERGLSAGRPRARLAQGAAMPPAHLSGPLHPGHPLQPAQQGPRPRRAAGEATRRAEHS